MIESDARKRIHAVGVCAPIRGEGAHGFSLVGRKLNALDRRSNACDSKPLPLRLVLRFATEDDLVGSASLGLDVETGFEQADKGDWRDRIGAAAAKGDSRYPAVFG